MYARAFSQVGMPAGNGGATWVSRQPMRTSTRISMLRPTVTWMSCIRSCRGEWSGKPSFMYQPRQSWVTISAAMIQCSVIATALYRLSSTIGGPPPSPLPRRLMKIT